MKIAVIGARGAVGRPIVDAFDGAVSQVEIDTPRETVADAMKDAVTFVCLPTPTIAPGQVDCAAIRQYVNDPYAHPRAWVVCSTVFPGFCRSLNAASPVYHVPIFANEATMREDISDSGLLVIGSKNGATEEDVEAVICELFPAAELVRCRWEESELAKYAANCFYAVKNAYWNEVYDRAQLLDADYGVVRDIACASRGWIHSMHTVVPGRDGRGFAGKCLPKDARAFSLFSEMVAAALAVNDRVRGGK